ncbi:DUF1648 domain-containing protein [Eggerthella lenta]|uniref:DUF1648 domain-containing protein n=1 Tax=Eggerthella lenta TaxID=84112 RepID=UPI00189CEC8F|nr:DUF1648 domain-containing protein [Eggerthella lenta]
MKRSGLIAMIALTLLPLVMTGLAVLFVLPDTIPLHAGAGGVDRVGSKFGAFEISSFLVGFGVLATILYAFMDKLAAKYQSDAHSGRVLLVFALSLMNVLQLVFILWMATGV